MNYCELCGVAESSDIKIQTYDGQLILPYPVTVCPECMATLQGHYKKVSEDLRDFVAECNKYYESLKTN